MRRQSSCLPSQQQLSAPFLDDAVIGEVQGGHETVQPGAQWRHPDLAEPFCYTIRSGMSAAGSAHSSYGAEAAGPCPDCCWAGRAFAFCPVQVIGLCEKKRDPQPKHIIADTPGQIEIFTWSASGAIITEVPSCQTHRCTLAHPGSAHKTWCVWQPLHSAVHRTCSQPSTCVANAVVGMLPQAFASTFPTMVAYVIDTPRCMQPQVFMSNMLQVSPRTRYACCTLLLCSLRGRCALVGVHKLLFPTGLQHPVQDAAAAAACFQQDRHCAA